MKIHSWADTSSLAVALFCLYVIPTTWAADCATITSSGGTYTTLPINQMTQIIFDTVLSDPDGAADLPHSQIKVPSWAKYVQVRGHVDFTWDGLAGYASLHLFRNNTSTPEAYYHVRVSYPGSYPPDYVTAFGSSPIVPVKGANETWQLYGWQSTNAPVEAPVRAGGPGAWLEVCFYP